MSGEISDSTWCGGKLYILGGENWQIWNRVEDAEDEKENLDDGNDGREGNDGKHQKSYACSTF